jgi:HEAT repeat protein
MRRAFGCLVGVAIACVGHEASASPFDAEPAVSLGPHSLRQHFGVEVARRLLRGADSSARGEDMLRGIERAASLGAPEGAALLVQMVSDPRGIARTDTRILLALTRALAPFVNEHGVARALGEFVLGAPAIRPAARRSDEDASVSSDAERRARLELARETAALALAIGGDEKAVDFLIAAARGTGPGQAAATVALESFPPIVLPEVVALTPGTIALAGALGDLRAGDALLEAAHSLDPLLRSAGLVALGATGDARVIPAAKGADRDVDLGVRKAAAEALVQVGALEASHAVRGLLDEDATAARGIELAERTPGSEVTTGLVNRVRSMSDRAVRVAAIVALGHRTDPKALEALIAALGDPVLAGDAAEALARSPLSAAWDVIYQRLLDPKTRRLGARMAAVRGRLAPPPAAVLRLLEDVARAPDAVDRAAGVSALVLLGDLDVGRALEDKDPRVRRAAAMASDPTASRAAPLLLGRLDREDDALTRLVLGGGLASGDHDALVSTKDLLVRAREAEADAPVSALALASRGQEPERGAIDAALASSDPLLRAHAAKGLATSPDRTATGRLALAYDAETDPGTRRAIILALVERSIDRGAPLRDQALDRAGRVDPDPQIRAIAWRGLLGLPRPEARPASDAIWVRVMTPTGEKPTGLAPASGGPPGVPFSGLIVRADGLAVPVVFDEDGYALVPGPSGPARLVLAPRLAAYEALPHGD